jgi:tetratricopeptide (TPR) repeat protein
MKQKNLIFIFLFFGQIILFAQGNSNKRDTILFEKGYLLQQLVKDDLDLDEIINSEDNDNINKELAIDIKETILHKALENYRELIKNFPKSKLLFRTLNNKGFIELALDDRDNAKKTFQKILESNADDNEKGETGSGIMAEPYANYKNRALKMLAELNIKEGKYAEAIKHLDLTKIYPFKHFGGNEYASDHIYISELYAKCYIGLKDNKTALEYLLPNLIENGLADNSNLVALAYETATQKYSKDELKFKYNQAFKNYKRVRLKNKDYQYNTYIITFLNSEIKLPSWQLEDLKPKEIQNEIHKIYNQSKFYKLLNE